MESEPQQPKKQEKYKFQICHTFSSYISNRINQFFYSLGFLLATHPWNTVIVSGLLVLSLSLGFIQFHVEKDPLKLWIPQDSTFLRDTEWLMDSYKEGYRIQSVIITAPNVLQPNVLQKVAMISEMVTNVTAKYPNGTTISWNDVCFKVPIIAEINPTTDLHRKRRDIDGFDFDDDEFSDMVNKNDSSNTANEDENNLLDPSVSLPSILYCSLIENLPMGCYQQNLLELWKINSKIIQNLTMQDILNTVNTKKISPVTGHETDFAKLLGGIERNETGHIVSATSLIINWMIYLNFSADQNEIGNSAGTEEWGSVEALLWEKEYLTTMEYLQRTLFTSDFNIYYTAGRSYGDISSETMFQDMNKLFIGGTLMFIFMQIVLSKFSWIEMRVTLCSMGLLCIGMAYLSMVGVCSVFGIFYGPVHNSLPFLLMGLGVDDMFVVMACWRHVQMKYEKLSIPEKIGLMLGEAGASITITSITDVVAFMVGASTILPSLQSFCIYAGIGIFFTYFYVITFFIGVFTLDEYRIQAKRNTLIPCIVHTDDKLWFDKKLMDKCITEIYTKFVFTKIGKMIIILFVICISGFSIESLFKLKQKFDPIWFVPERTYHYKYQMKKEELYPDIGFESAVYMGQLNYTIELPKILKIVNVIENRTNIVHNINSWTYGFEKFVKNNFKKNIFEENLSDYEFNTYLSKFLFSNSGGKYQANFRFKNKLKCGQPISNITVSSIHFMYKRFTERNDYVPAMREMENILRNANLTSGDGFSTVWGKVYGNWITDEVIDVEVLRNILLALICVMFCTAVLIVDPQICIWILLCVVLTLINVCGFMERWGLTIDLVSCIGLELAVGLCVDYAAHIGHTFLTIQNGTRTERALSTVKQIGSAVFYGGTSTLLAVAMLADSEAYTFKSFFKIFLLVIVFGLFHGLILLPVILSLVGPMPYKEKLINRKKLMDKKALEDAEAVGTEMITFLQQKSSINNDSTINTATISTNNGDNKSVSKVPDGDKIKKIKRKDSMSNIDEIRQMTDDDDLT